MKTLKTNYYVGVLLSASRNDLNRMQFFTRKENGKTALYSRTRNFSSEPDARKMEFVGYFCSEESALDTINVARQEMSDRGLSVPGVTVHSLYKVRKH